MRSLLDDAKLLWPIFHLGHAFGEVLGFVAVHVKANIAVVAAHPVAHLATEQLVYGQASGFAGDIPQGHFDGANGAAPRFEAGQAADALHNAFDVGGILSEDATLVKENVRFYVVCFTCFDLAISGNTFIGADAQDGMVAQYCTLESSNLHRKPFLYGVTTRGWSRLFFTIDTPLKRR